MRWLHCLLFMALIAPTGTFGKGTITYSVDQDVDDVLFVIESEIVRLGLKIDSISHVGTMLKRTGVDLGATKQIFTRAEVFSFCSATVSRRVMEANPNNLVFCPYTIFVYVAPGNNGKTEVGFSDYPPNEMYIVEDLLDGIVREALELD